MRSITGRTAKLIVTVAITILILCHEHIATTVTPATISVAPIHAATVLIIVTTVIPTIISSSLDPKATVLKVQYQVLVIQLLLLVTAAIIIEVITAIMAIQLQSTGTIMLSMVKLSPLLSTVMANE